MRIDLFVPEEWERIRSFLRSGLFPHPEESWACGPGLASGVFEYGLALAQIYSHRRSVAVIQGVSPAFDTLSAWFLRESYQLQKIDAAALRTPEDSVTWIESLKKDTVLLVVPEDHPVTGAKFAWSEVDRLANEKKIFVLRASHQSHRYEREPLRPYSMRICSVRPDLAVMGCGSRVRIHPSFSHRWSWTGGDLTEVLRQEFEADCPPLKRIEDFEALFGEARWFASGEDRLLDRVVLSFGDVSGEALREELRADGYRDVETANLCRWDSLKAYREWWKPLPEDDRLRGLLLIPSIHVASDGDAKRLEAALRRSLKAVQSRQEWV